MTQTSPPLATKQKNIDQPPLGWGPTAAIIISILAYIASQVVLILSVLPIAFFNKNSDIEVLLSDSPWINLVLTGVSSVALIAVLWLFLKSRKQSFKSLGFKKTKLSDFGWLGITVVAYFIVLVITMSVASNIPGFDADQQQDVGFNGVVGWQLGLAFIGLVILPPIAEEMLFRGFLYRGLATKWPRIVAALFTSLLFALVHFQWNVGLDVFVLSLFLIALYEKTKNLWMCIFMHAIKNGLAFLAIFVFIS